jgi:DNA-binding transcriptional LysR family regulator
MNLQQFRFVRETIRRDFNLTEAARSLFTSQPGVSKAILEFEDEQGGCTDPDQGQKDSDMFKHDGIR